MVHILSNSFLYSSPDFVPFPSMLATFSGIRHGINAGYKIHLLTR